MMHIFDIASKDLRQIWRDRKSLLFLLVMPIVFTMMFGLAFAGTGDEVEDDARLPVAVLLHDEGPLAEALLVLLEQSDVVLLQEMPAPSEEALEEEVADGRLAGAVVVPAGYTEGLLASGTAAPPLHVITNPAGGRAEAVQTAVQTAALRLVAAARAAQITAEALDAHDVGGGSDGALDAALAAWRRPPVQVAHMTTGPAEQAEESADVSAFSHSSPAMMAQFTIAGLISAAQILVLERTGGALRRLLMTTASRFEILAGHFLAMFIMIFLQLALLILFGQLFLGLNYFGAPLATLLLALASALFAAGLGLLVGALSRTEEQVIIYALIPMFVFSGLGGAWVPLELTPETFQLVARFTPLAWMVDGFKDILIRGQGLVDVLPSAIVLTAFAVGAVILASWRFRFE